MATSTELVVKDTSRRSYFVNPAAGLHQGVIVDWVDLGDVEETYQGQTKVSRKVQAVVQLASRITPDDILRAKAEAGEEAVLDESDKKLVGKRFQVRTRKYTFSIGEKANLRKDLVSLRGRDFSKEELKGFKLEATLGTNASVNVIIREGKGANAGRFFANIQTLSPWNNGFGEPIAADDYTRVKDRQKDDAPAQSAPAVAPTKTDEIPFN